MVPDAVTIAPSGVIDLQTAPALDERIRAALAELPARGRLVVDLREVRLLDSAGIRTLLHARRDADVAGSEFRITGAHGIVLSALELTGVAEHLAGGCGGSA
ncbi:STAS domain-containing protein [Dactylosporangium sp. NPDC000244]|uniref:STAS domain-containing protein n=1 Tax=Dactylosporangium sp. NPDC000244 TaxID=3154365 RepID=UPI0033191962